MAQTQTQSQPQFGKDEITNSFRHYQQKLTETKANYFKKRACEDILNALLVYPHSINSEEDINLFMKHIGKKNAKSTVNRMKTILEKGFLPEVKEYYAQSRDNTREDAISALSSVYGIGSVKATQLYDQHQILTVEQLAEEFAKPSTTIKLTDAQKAGITHYDDLHTRIPRQEIAQYLKFCKTIVKSLDPKAKICIAGSYRRGLKTSGDIDILISTRSSPGLLMEELLQKLESKIEVVLSQGNKKSMLLCKLDDKSRVRHVDIVLTNPRQYAFAQLYFTGSKMFNIKMRAHALSRGLSMNEYGFTIVNKQNQKKNQNQEHQKRNQKQEHQNRNQNNQTESNNDDTNIKIPSLLTERSIFKYLEYPYVSPKER